MDPPDQAPPADIVTLVQAGKQALEAGDLESALARFESVVAQFPERPEGFNNLGALYTALGQFEQAEACFSKVLEVLPANDNVRYNRGVVRIRLREFASARADFEAVLNTNPHDADCWNNLGVAAFLQQDFATARDHFLRALELAPDFPNAVLNLADADLAEGERAQAIARCEDYLEHFTAAEVQEKLLDLLETEIHSCLTSACTVAAQIKSAARDDVAFTDRHERLQQAREILISPQQSAQVDA
jgi:Tfp pilus assembly protein PilF